MEWAITVVGQHAPSSTKACTGRSRQSRAADALRHSARLFSDIATDLTRFARLELCADREGVRPLPTPPCRQISIPTWKENSISSTIAALYDPSQPEAQHAREFMNGFECGEIFLAGMAGGQAIPRRRSDRGVEEDHLQPIFMIWRQDRVLASSTRTRRETMTRCDGPRMRFPATH